MTTDNNDAAMADYVVILDGRSQPLMETALYEAEYIRQILGAAERAGAEVRSRAVSVFTGHEPESLRRSKPSAGAIAFVFDERCQRWPEHEGGRSVLLQSYIGDADLLGPRHLLLPLGFARSFKPMPAPPPSKRDISLFFSGNLHVGRSGFHRWLSGWPLPFAVRHRLQRAAGRTFDDRFAPSYSRFTDGFGRGLSGEAYSEFLARSKVVLCPGGSCSVESYRFYEAILAGCVVVTERLPQRRSFADCPAVFVDNWREADHVLEEILDDPVGLDRRARLLRDWYEQHASADVVGRELAGALKRVPWR